LLGQQEAGDRTAANPQRILSVTYDRSLAATREMLFTGAGFQVATVSTVGHAIQLCAAESFDLIVIGHSIPLQQRELLLKEARRQCGTPTLAFCRHGEPSLSDADYIFDSAESPEFLLETVVEILRPQSRNPKHGAQLSAPRATDSREHRTAKKGTTRAKRLDRFSL
jgi:DNA-binding NtrC family response regulator